MQNQHFDEQPFFVRYGFLAQIHVVFQDARQLRSFVKLAPDVPVFIVDGYEIADSPRPFVFGVAQAEKSKLATMPTL